MWISSMQSDRVSASFTDRQPALPTGPPALQSRTLESQLFVNQNDFNLPTRWMQRLHQRFCDGNIMQMPRLTQHNLRPPSPSVSTSSATASPHFNNFSQNWWRSLQVMCLCYVTYWRKSEEIRKELYCHFTAGSYTLILITYLSGNLFVTTQEFFILWLTQQW